MMVLFSTNPSTWSLPKLTGYGVEIKSAARVKMEGGEGGLVWGKLADDKYKLPQDRAGKLRLPPRSNGWSQLWFIRKGLLVSELSPKRGFLTARCLWHHARGFQPFPQFETCNMSQGSPARCTPQTHLLGCPALGSCAPLFPLFLPNVNYQAWSGLTCARPGSAALRFFFWDRRRFLCPGEADSLSKTAFPHPAGKKSSSQGFHIPPHPKVALLGTKSSIQNLISPSEALCLNPAPNEARFCVWIFVQHDLDQDQLMLQRAKMSSDGKGS